MTASQQKTVYGLIARLSISSMIVNLTVPISRNEQAPTFLSVFVKAARKPPDNRCPHTCFYDQPIAISCAIVCQRGDGDQVIPALYQATEAIVAYG